MTIKYFDIHSHLNLPPLSENKEAIVAKMKELGVATITVGTGLETSHEAVRIAEENPELCWATVGIHPCDIPSPALPKGKGAAPGYLTGSGFSIKELMMKAKEMRSDPTLAEARMWSVLKGDNMGVHFRQQHIIDRFIVDFVCLTKKLIIEIDGGVHINQQERDRERSEILELLGFKVLRFSNDQVLSQLESVIAEIKNYLLVTKEDSLPFGKGRGWDDLCKLATHPKVVAIGETGLDYFHEDTPESRKIQEDIFKKHISLAEKVKKPLMLHVRASKGSDNAYYDALEILKNSSASQEASSEALSFREGGRRQPPGVSANFHFFSGSSACMEAIIAAGYTVSVDGPITFSRDYDEMIKAVPLESLMIETDAPFAAPVPYRGKPCEPWMVIEVAKKIAELKELNEDVVRQQLLTNSRNFFGI
jgi:TatD family hydrolase